MAGGKGHRVRRIGPRPGHHHAHQPERLNRDRLRAVAIAAAEQSERLSLPEIHAAAPLARLVAAWPADRRLLVCDEGATGAPIAEALAAMLQAPTALFVGPEGGFTETELDASR